MMFMVQSVMWCIILSVILITAISVVQFLGSSPLSDDTLSFESGFSPFSLHLTPLSTRFFLVLIFFIVLDIELVLLFPAVTKMIFMSSIIISVFIFIFLCGLGYEWASGALSWVQ